MKNIFHSLVLGIAILLSLPMSAYANVFSITDIKVSGFGSIVGNITNEGAADYLRNAKVNDSLNVVNETRVGLQFNVPISDEIEFVTQFTGDQQDDTYSINAEWILGKWQVNDMISVRGGRFVLPVLAQSDTINVHFAHPGIRNPSEVYEVLPLSNFNGLDLIANIPVGDNFLVLQPFIGSAELKSPFGFAGTVTTNIDDLLGLKVRWETEDHAFYLAWMDITVSMTDPGIVSALVNLGTIPSAVLISGVLSDVGAKFISAGWIGRFGNIEVHSEYVKRTLESTAVAGVKAAYVTAIYNMGDYAPYGTYATTESTNGTPQTQVSYTFGLRQNVASNASMKYELHYADIDEDIAGNRGLFALSNPSSTVFPSSVMLLSVALDVVF